MIIASIDIGSNTILLLIARVELESGVIIPLRDEQRIPRIAKGLTPGGIISENSIAQMLIVLRDYFELINKYKCETVLLSGTSAFRLASNSNEIFLKIKNKYNVSLNILTGEEEAEYAFWGTEEYSKFSENRLVIDIGGGSTEIIYGNQNGILYKKSFDIGVVSLSERYLDYKLQGKEKVAEIREAINQKFALLPISKLAPVKTVAIAGTPVTLACIQKELQFYKEGDVEGSILTLAEIKNLCEYFIKYSPGELLNLYPNILQNREDLILSGSLILLYISELFGIDKVIVSTNGIRFGAIIKYIRTNYK